MSTSAINAFTSIGANTKTRFITLNIIQVLLVVWFIVLKGIFMTRMFAGKFYDQAIVQVPFTVWIFLFQYQLFFFQSCIRSSRDLLFSTYSYGTVYKYIGIDSALSTGTISFSFAVILFWIFYMMTVFYIMMTVFLPKWKSYKIDF